MQGVNPEKTQLLAQLRDIHPGAEPGWWPPAPAWWLLAAVAACGVFLLMRALVRRLFVLRRRRAWLRVVDELEGRWDPDAQPHEYLAALNRLFRAVALKAFPGTPCSRLQGEEWVAFIRGRLPGGRGGQSLDALAHGPYEPLPEFDAPALREQARTWVKLHG